MGVENIWLGFQVAVTPFNLMVAVIGILLGTIIGVLPGLGGANGVAILLPLTFTMPPTSGIILLTSIYWGALFGGAITSFLIFPESHGRSRPLSTVIRWRAGGMADKRSLLLLPPRSSARFSRSY
jgi:TctA family transporter